MRQEIGVALILGYSLFASGCPLDVARNQNTMMNTIRPPYEPHARVVDQHDVQRTKKLKHRDYAVPSLYRK